MLSKRHAIKVKHEVLDMQHHRRCTTPARSAHFSTFGCCMCTVHVLPSGDAGSYDLFARFFGPWAGIEEDPVTGSAYSGENFLAHSTS